MATPTIFSENMVILWFERRFSKQNTVIRLKSNILPHPKLLSWLRHCLQPHSVGASRLTIGLLATGGKI